MVLLQFIFLFFFCSVIQARISPKPDESVYNVAGFTPGKFHTCEIIDIFVLPDEATILSIVNINNAGPWSLPSSYLEIMYRNGSTMQLSTSVIGDTTGRCTFGAKFIPYYNNNQGNAVVLMCSSFTFPGGDTQFFRFKIDPVTATLTPIGTPLTFHSENSFARFSSQPVTATNDVYFLLNSYPQAWNNYSVGHLNLVDFTFETWPVVLPSESPFFLDASVGIFNNVAQVDQLLFSAGCGSHDSSTSIPEMMCTYKYSDTKQFVLVGMNPIPNARSYRNLYMYGPGGQHWGVTITSASLTASISIMNTQFSAPTNASHDVIYGATLNDTDVILTFTVMPSISQLRDRCFYLATAHGGTNELVVQQLKLGEDFEKTPTTLIDATTVSTVVGSFTSTLLFTTKNHLFVTEELKIYRYVVEC